MSKYLVIAFIAAVSFESSVNADVYVSPTGKDTNPGTEASPVASLQQARDLVRRQRQESKLPPSSNVHVWIEQGDYEMQEPLILSAEDSHSIYQVRPGAKVNVRGGRQIAADSFQRVTDPAVLRRLEGSLARENVVQVNLRELGITDYGALRRYGHMLPVVCSPLELFVNKEAWQLARYPNEGDIELRRIIDPGSVPRIGDYSERGGTFEYTDPRHARWASVDDVWIQGTLNNGYADDNIPIESIDAERRQVKLASEHMYGLAGDAPYRKYFVYNVLEELDTPGEWYLDRKTGIMYLWPKGDLAKATIVLSMLEEPILCLENASEVTIDGIVLEAGRGVGIYLEGGARNTIRNCTVRNVGTTGILMGMGAEQTFPHITHDDYVGRPISRQIGSLQAHLYHDTTWNRNAGREHQIINCVVSNTGAGGIYLSGGSKQTLTPGRSKVSNCLIHDYNRRSKFLWSGINVDGCGNEVSNCEVSNSDFQGIYVRGNDHVFEYNYLHDLAMDSDDTSAWYLGRDPSDRGNIIRYNYFENIGRSDRMVMGIYLDDGACGVEVFGNVFFRTASRGTVFSNSGHDIKVINNIFVESLGPAVELNSIWYNITDKHRASFFGFPPGSAVDSDADQPSNVTFNRDRESLFERRLLQSVDIRKAPYSVRYPELADYMEYLEDGSTRVGQRPRGNLMAKNVVYRCPEVLKLRAPYAEVEDQDNFVTERDPGFVDVKNRDFTLRKDAAVFQVIDDFKPIPFDRIGRHASKSN